MAASADSDENLWLEEVLGDRPLEWVKAQSDQAVSQIGEPKASPLYDRLLAILQSKDKIPNVRKVDDYYYNFWQDDEHVRGIWRRTSWEEYQKAEPDWELVLDVDALGKEEGESWVYKGAPIIDVDGQPRDRALMKLSRAGADATVIREFDLVAKRFVSEADGGFCVVEAKTNICWKDRDTVYIGTNFGEGSLTDSGYPRQAKQWRRGTPMQDAELIFEGQQTDVAVSADWDVEVGMNYDWVHRMITFYTAEYFLRVNGELKKVLVPEDVMVNCFADQILLQLRKDWVGFDGKSYTAGSLLAVHWESAIKEGASPITVLFEASETKSLETYCHTQQYLILTILEHVQTKVLFWKLSSGTFTMLDVPFTGDNFTAVDVTPLSHRSDDVFLSLSGFALPTTLSFGTVTDAGVPQADLRALKALPDMFDRTGVEVEQFFCESKDGTRIPYFQIGRRMEGPRPTVLYGYGGFEVSLTPAYMGVNGAGWLEKGHSFVMCNIRGGGEYGPRWHQAALKEKRHKAYEDFIAVGEDLIRRSVCTVSTLGIMGGSNGGLLMGNMLVMRPDLWGAVICQVPLLDMKRYHTLLAGASWMGEYGNPETDDWEFLQKYSPYQLLKSKEDQPAYPQLFVTTSTRDDRVHPGHARKFVKRLQDLGHGATTVYWENLEGGHGGAADAPQQAYMRCLMFGFLEKQLCA